MAASRTRTPRQPKVQPLELGYTDTWEKNGQERQLSNPDGKPTDRQLWMLHKNGMLVIVAPGKGQDFNKGNASWALNQL